MNVELGGSRRSRIDERVPPRPPRWLALALFCGIAPLVVGVPCYLGWRATQAPSLGIAGLFVLLFGGILFVTGWVALLAHGASTPVVQAAERRRKRLGMTIAAVLLAAQVPLLVLALGGVASARDTYRIRVENGSDARMLGLVVWGASLSEKLGDVPAGGDATFDLELPKEETLRYEAAWRKELLKGVLDDHALRGGGITLRLESDGQVVLLPD